MTAFYATVFFISNVFIGAVITVLFIFDLKGLAQDKIIEKSVILFWLLNMTVCTLMTSQGSDTVTSIFKRNSSITIRSLGLLKMA